MSVSLTVGIPFYYHTNVEQFKEAVDSIISQTRPPDILHLIQDGPISDELEAAVNSLWAQHSEKIQHIILPHNTGLSYALNISILSTTSTYYARMDADDIAHPMRLEKQINYLEEHPEIEILGTWIKEFEHDPNALSCMIRKLPTELNDIATLFHYRNPLAHPTVVFRRSVFAKIGLYDITFGTEGDLELWGRALNAGIGITNLAEPLLFYRMTGVIDRRSDIHKIVSQVRAKYRYNTWSPRLNALKILSVLFRLLPRSYRNWGYKNLRDLSSSYL